MEDKSPGFKPDWVQTKVSMELQRCGNACLPGQCFHPLLPSPAHTRPAVLPQVENKSRGLKPSWVQTKELVELQSVVTLAASYGSRRYLADQSVHPSYPD